ncbi:LysR family transcriptional regulator [Saccharobesus litoralis]|uniref:LysR family transcriptional regulator n=1 Tax=Saccharobesus litoralis TaxID=2172099 RepID=A0A2S0VVB9_9ALTE|nr:hydrogen peroxide-inducible genes activator [Saccharobesus litoralis]AWB68167.1 LysR family transcriptional regulator [Saccharobesus litoralis]
MSNRHRPSLKALQYLLALHQEQNFNRAAKQCFVSQSTLSTAIQNLEEQLNCQVIERDHKRFHFTPTGEQVVLRTKQILAQVDDLLAFTADQSGDMQGEISIGCIPTIAPYLLPRLIESCAVQFPKLTLMLREDTTENLLKLLQQNRIDLLVLALPVDTGDLMVKTLFHDNFMLVGHPEVIDPFPASGIGKDVPDHSIFLLEKEHCLSDHAVSACQLKGGNKIHPFSATSLHTLVQMMRQKAGASYFPKMAIDNGILNGTELESRSLAGNQAYREIGLVWRPTTARLKTFMQLGECIKFLFAKD